MCHMSRVTCNKSHVRCNVWGVKFHFFSSFFGQSGGATQGGPVVKYDQLSKDDDDTSFYSLLGYALYNIYTILYYSEPSNYSLLTLISVPWFSLSGQGIQSSTLHFVLLSIISPCVCIAQMYYLFKVICFTNLGIKKEY